MADDPSTIVAGQGHWAESLVGVASGQKCMRTSVKQQSSLHSSGQIVWIPQVKTVFGLRTPPLLPNGSAWGNFLPVAVNKRSIIPSRLPRKPSADQLITMCSAASTYSHIQQFHESHISRSICNIKPDSSLLPLFDQIRSVLISRSS